MLDFNSPYAQETSADQSKRPSTPKAAHAATTDAAISRLIIILPDQQRTDLPALAAAAPRRDVILVDGEVDEAFAHAVSALGFRFATEIDPCAALETRIARCLRNQTRRRIAVSKPESQAVYQRVIGWAAAFGVTVDIHFPTISDPA